MTGDPNLEQHIADKYNSPEIRRKEGYYHVKINSGIWDVCRWIDGQWLVAGIGQPFSDTDMEGIGAYIPSPDEVIL